MHEVDACRKKGNAIAVSTQEFALIPKTVQPRMQLPNEILDELNKERASAVVANRGQEMMQYLLFLQESLKQVRNCCEQQVSALVGCEQHVGELIQTLWAGHHQ